MYRPKYTLKSRLKFGLNTRKFFTVVTRNPCLIQKSIVGVKFVDFIEIIKSYGTGKSRGGTADANGINFPYHLLL